ncbi:MAG: heat-inducible transcription repressor HrcA [Myxococcales bacterium]|nr:heat-inducible transcription repressor HrcA [Myxococcales bacterium]
MQLGPREREILGAICREYIVSGDAVGSRALVKRAGIGQSPATVRNVMSDLEEQGLLVKPHTSAGRVPTDEGLRFFVDRLMKSRELSDEQQAEIRARFSLTNHQLDSLLREISRMLSDLSQQCGLVLVPRSETSRLKRIEFIPLRPGKMIAVLVMSSGMVQNRLIDVAIEPDGEELEQIHRYLNDLCAGRELHEVRRLVKHELEREEVLADELQQRALLLGSEVVAEPAEDEVVIAGRTNLVRENVSDPERLKSLLRAVEEKKTMVRLLDETIGAEGVKVFIGAETRDRELEGLSIVAAAYGGTRPLGTLGVIGPSNMDYPRVMPLVDFTASVLTEILRGS